MGKKTSHNTGVDTNWNSGELHFYAVGTGYIADTASMRLWNHGDMETISSIRAPIFYDSNDTGYFCDPNSRSHFSGSQAQVLQLDQNISQTGANFNDALFVRNVASGHFSQIGMSTNDSDGQHHRVSFRAYKSADGQYAGEFRLALRQPTSANHTERLKVTSAGNLSVDGNITAYASDIRLKENITPILNALDKVLKIRGVEFDWKDECESLGFKPSWKHESGLIAQEVQEVISDAVSPAPFNNEYLTVHKDKLIPLLIEAIKEQNQRIDMLQNTVDILTAKLNTR